MKILRLSADSFDKIIIKAAKEIKEGKVLVSPSDTVYGLVADATNKKAVEKIFKIKKRPKSKPLAVFVKDIGQAKKLAFIDAKQEKFLRKNTPGKITIILKKKPSCGLPDSVGGEGTIGIRIIKNKPINKLLSKIKKPLAQTSANISGRPATTKIGEVLKYWEDGGPNDSKMRIKPDLMIDGGNLPKSRPSKIVDLSTQKMIILKRW